MENEFYNDFPINVTRNFGFCNRTAFAWTNVKATKIKRAHEGLKETRTGLTEGFTEGFTRTTLSAKMLENHRFLNENSRTTLPGHVFTQVSNDFSKLSANKVPCSLVLIGGPPKVLLFHWFWLVGRERSCFFICYTRLSAKSVVFSLVLEGCPREVLFFHWFYKVVREKCCFFISFTRLSAENVEKALVFLGCPRKRLFLHWFYKVVREKCCFYIGFIRLSAKNVVFTLVLQGLSTKMLAKPA